MATTDIQQSNNSRLPSQLVTTQLMGNKIAIAALTKSNVIVDQYTTLNEVHDVMAATSIGEKNGADFKLQYYGIGIKGAQFQGNDVNGIPRMIVNQHQPTNVNAFYPIPFVVREITNDLSNAERARYRMRVILVVNNVTYVAYYLKLTGFSSFVPSLKIVTKDANTGNEVPDTYVPQQDAMHPQPIAAKPDGTVPVSNQYVTASGRLDLSLDTNELEEIKNACRILFGDASYGAINEYYIVNGIDTTNDGAIVPGGSQNIRYAEVQSAVITYTITETHPRDANASGKMELYFDIGASAPLLLATS